MILGSAASFAIYINSHSSQQNRKYIFAYALYVICVIKNKKTKKNHISSIDHKCTYVIAPYTRSKHSQLSDSKRDSPSSASLELISRPNERENKMETVKCKKKMEIIEPSSTYKTKQNNTAQRSATQQIQCECPTCCFVCCHLALALTNDHMNDVK